MKKGSLVLKDGSMFEGWVPQDQVEFADGEVVFTTGMTGYEESLTDPSYSGQIMVFTFPLIGNYGVNDAEQWESEKIHAAGVVISNVCENWSHSSGEQSIVEWLKVQKVPLITGVDTRQVTKILRDAGVMLGAITTEKKKNYLFQDPNAESMMQRVSLSEKKLVGSGSKHIIAVDCGMKRNIRRHLESLPVRVTYVPYDYDYSNEEYDGIFLSNGPGDPETCKESISVLKKAMAREKPIFGICLGSQLMALAAGAKTYKLRYGHRGHNQPCMHTQTERCYITSQNHGYAVDEVSLPEEWIVSFRNLNDGTVEGIQHKSLPFSAVQFHPEAAPGSTDTQWLFEEFYAKL